MAEDRPVKVVMADERNPVTLTMWAFALGIVAAVFALVVWIEAQLGNYLTLREHQAFFETTNREVKRLEESNLQQNKMIERMVAEKAGREGLDNTNKRIEQIYTLLNEMRRDISDLQKRTPNNNRP